MRFVFAILLNVAHLIVNIWELILRKLSQFMSRKRLCKFNHVPILTSRLSQVKKFPTSIAIISPSHSISCKVSKEDSVIEKSLFIIKWASYIGIKHITLYDPEGYFAARKTYFEDRIKLMFVSGPNDSNFTSDQTFTIHSSWNSSLRHRKVVSDHLHQPNYIANGNSSVTSKNNNKQFITHQNGISNGYSKLSVETHTPCTNSKITFPSINFNSGQLTSTVTVNFLSLSHSRNHMVHLAQEFVNENFNRRKVHQLGDEEDKESTCTKQKLTVEEIEERINRDFNFPEPDLLIEFTPAPCLLGFHPWRAKLSEIVILPQCSGEDELSVLNSLVSVLERYNKCEKRVGR